MADAGGSAPEVFPWAYLIAGGVAASTSFVELLAYHRTLPIGPSRAWRDSLVASSIWATILLVDILLAAAFVIGLLAVSGISTVGDVVNDETLSFILSWATIGLIGPLGVRSPVAARSVQNRVSALSLLNVYNSGRSWLLGALEKAIRTIRRSRAAALARKLVERNGWTAKELRGRIQEQLPIELDQADELREIENELRAARTAGRDQAIADAMIVVLYESRQFSLVRMLKSAVRESSEEDQGRRAYAADLRRFDEELEELGRARDEVQASYDA